MIVCIVLLTFAADGGVLHSRLLADLPEVLDLQIMDGARYDCRYRAQEPPERIEELRDKLIAVRDDLGPTYRS
jgi:hypothetical protein